MLCFLVKKNDIFVFLLQFAVLTISVPTFDKVTVAVAVVLGDRIAERAEKARFIVGLECFDGPDNIEERQYTV